LKQLLRAVSACALLAALGATDTPSPAPSGATIAVPRGTIIYVTVTKDIRVGGAGTTSEVHKVDLEVTQDVIVNGNAIARTGDLAEGEYTTQRNVTKRVFSEDVSQEVSLDVNDIVNFCGDLRWSFTQLITVRVG
jgi:hypothetical protein